MYRDLSQVGDGELYDALDSVDRLRACEGQGRGPEAAHVRIWCRQEKARIARELRGRGLPGTRPDGRWTGVGRGFIVQSENVTVGGPA